MIYNCPTELVFDNIFLNIKNVLPDNSIYLKIEGLTTGGSIKIKAALHMIKMFESSGRLVKGGALIESSSGNLGLALSMVCAARGYHFTCVSDPNISPQTARMIKAYGANLIIITEKDSNGGFLGSRIKLIKKMTANDPSLIWVNQYENIHNVEAHYRTTAPSILANFPQVDYLFVGAGTTGTLGGVSNYFKNFSPATKIIAVDSVGSVTFGGEPARRYIPGLGTSTPPQIRDLSRFDQLLMIPESETVAMCHNLARKGIFLGGSSATVLASIASYEEKIPPSAVVVAISPDLGDRYIDTIYNPEWVAERFPRVLGAQSEVKKLTDTCM